jgi:hypothetical protein
VTAKQTAPAPGSFDCAAAAISIIMEIFKLVVDIFNMAALFDKTSNTTVLPNSSQPKDEVGGFREFKKPRYI